MAIMVEIKGVEITEDSVRIEAVNLDSILLSTDLFAEMEEEPIYFEFDRNSKGCKDYKYLYKVVNSQKRCKGCKSFGEQIEKLVGVITTLSENFVA